MFDRSAELFFPSVTSVPDTAEFWHCKDSAAVYHFYTTSSNCEGRLDVVNEGRIGFIATSATCGAVPLYHLKQPVSEDHLYTIDPAERDSVATSIGWVDEGIAGYVWTSP